MSAAANTFSTQRRCDNIEKEKIIMTETIALFGATGGTGKQFLPLALDAGYKVKAMVRTPSNVETKHENLTLVEGDFSNEDALKKTVEGATYVVSMAGGPMGKPKEYPKDLMLNFVKKLLAIMKESPTVKTFLYQAGAFSAKPDGSLPVSMKVFRTMVGAWMMGLKPNYLDNEAVIKYVDSEKDACKFKIIVTRPGALKEEEGGKKLEASDKPEMGAVTFKDLAVFSLEAMKDESLAGKYPFVKIAK
jgi:hypothetical protein